MRSTCSSPRAGVESSRRTFAPAPAPSQSAKNTTRSTTPRLDAALATVTAAPPRRGTSDAVCSVRERNAGFTGKPRSVSVMASASVIEDIRTR